MACLGVLSWHATSAAQPQASFAERAEVEAERVALQERIAAIEADIRRREAEQDAAAKALREVEQAVSEHTRRLAELDDQGAALQAERTTLEQRQVELQEALAERRETLAALLRQQYVQGTDSPWQVLLDGQDPQDTGRRLTYLGYLARARAQAAQAIADEQAKLQEVGRQIEQRQASLDALRAEQLEQQQALEARRAERQQVLAQVRAELASQRSAADRLKDDAERLSDLVSSINAALAQQAEARRRREAVAAAEAAAEAEAARAAAQPVEPPRDDPQGLRPDEMVIEAPGRDASEPATPVARLTRRGAGDAVSGAGGSVASSAAAFAELRGQLPAPASGALQGRFGADRPNGGTWRGVFIAAPEGTPVRAVATGTVVFSGWLRGFGNLVIVDHDDDFLSVYGSNAAILRQVGDEVRQGDTLAHAGDTGGLAQSGIYFEIRHRGGPIDPMPWFRQ